MDEKSGDNKPFSLTLGEYFGFYLKSGQEVAGIFAGYSKFGDEPLIRLDKRNSAKYIDRDPFYHVFIMLNEISAFFKFND